MTFSKKPTHKPIYDHPLSKLFVEGFRFTANREYRQRDGTWGPGKKGGGHFKGGIQMNIYGSQDRYAKLARFFSKIASTFRPDSEGIDHHHCFFSSEDGDTHLQMIFRTGMDHNMQPLKKRKKLGKTTRYRPIGHR